MEFLPEYKFSVLVLGLTGVLFLLQLLVLDIAGIKARQIPGYAIQASHSSFLFRASRALANSNESAAILLLLLLFALLSQADAWWTNLGALVYLAGRVGHMICYYANIKLARSLAFGVSLIGLLIIAIAGLGRWL